MFKRCVAVFLMAAMLMGVVPTSLQAAPTDTEKLHTLIGRFDEWGYTEIPTAYWLMLFGYAQLDDDAVSLFAFFFWLFDNTNPTGRNGEYFDGHSNRYYMRARFMCNHTGRFLSEDPFWNIHNMIFGCERSRGPTWREGHPYRNAIIQSANLFMFAGHNPVMFHDPTGEFFIKIVAGIVGGAIYLYRKLSGSGSSGSSSSNQSRNQSRSTPQNQPQPQPAPSRTPAQQPQTQAPQMAGTATQATAANNSWGTTQNLINSATTPGQGGVTPIGRAFQKHSNRPVTAWTGRASGNAALNTEQGLTHLNTILSNPQTTFTIQNHSVYGNVLNVRLPCGMGARWSADGSQFIGVLERHTR